MVPALQLWLPVLLSAVIVFVVSSIIHMVLPYHKSDFKKLPSEDGVMDALRPFNIPPGEYVVPCPGSSQEMKDPAFIEKIEKGPAAFMTVLENKAPSMTTSLIQWFVYCALVGFFAAYVSGRALGPGADYLAVFRFVGATAFIGYAVGLWQNSIWYKRAWSTTLKSTFDGFLYACFTAGVFGWLWPS
jgi:hypothetical protein